MPHRNVKVYCRSNYDSSAARPQRANQPSRNARPRGALTGGALPEIPSGPPQFCVSVCKKRQQMSNS